MGARTGRRAPTLTSRQFIGYNGEFKDEAFWRSRGSGDERISMNVRIAWVLAFVCAMWAVSACFG